MYIPSFAEQFPTFQPAMRVIAGLTTTNPIQVTTTFDHQYKDGLIVRLDIPLGFGMQQADQLVGEVTVTSPTSFTLPIDALYFDPFILPVAFPPGYQDAQVVPVGENTLLLNSATENVLPY